MQDRRRTQRRKTYLGARVVFNHRQSTMDCLIRNMGDKGAKLVFTNAATLPDRFEVQVARLEKTLRARIAWRRQDELGITFLGSEESSNVIPLDAAMRLRNLQSENSHLQRRVAQLSVGE